MFKNLQIGYVPYNTDLSHPDDRRRFPFFAKRNKVEFEIADSNKFYDVILLPAPANLTKWLLYKKKNPQTRFVFEMVDSLIYQSDVFNTLFKGVGRFVLGKESLPSLHHKDVLIKWLKIADVVICSSEKIRSDIEKWNANVVVSLDYLEHEYRFTKTDYSIRGKMKLLWEGQGVIVPHFLHFKKMFKRVSSFCELHVVTSECFPKYGQFVKKDVGVFLKQLPITTHFHKWDINKNAQLFGAVDCGIIPLNNKNIYGWHKPANKLISFWLSGLPTLTSNTPAYIDAAGENNHEILCTNENDWVEKLQHLRDMKSEERALLAKGNFDYARSLYSNEKHDEIWEKLFNGISAASYIENVIYRPDYSRMDQAWGSTALLRSR